MAFRAVIIAAAIAMWAAPAHAMVCFDPIDGRANFYAQYGETEVGGGDLGNDKQNEMLLLANPKTRTWTIMIVRKVDGFLCPMASGENFKLKLPKVKGQKI